MTVKIDWQVGDIFEGAKQTTHSIYPINYAHDFVLFYFLLLWCYHQFLSDLCDIFSDSFHNRFTGIGANGWYTIKHEKTGTHKQRLYCIYIYVCVSVYIHTNGYRHAMILVLFKDIRIIYIQSILQHPHCFLFRCHCYIMPWRQTSNIPICCRSNCLNRFIYVTWWITLRTARLRNTLIHAHENTNEQDNHQIDETRFKSTVSADVPAPLWQI